MYPTSSKEESTLQTIEHIRSANGHAFGNRPVMRLSSNRTTLQTVANINATSTLGQTSLTTAITYNSHEVLKLLLDRWFEYSVCPRLHGPHLLQIAASYADIETIHILTNTNHFMLKYDRS